MFLKGFLVLSILFIWAVSVNTQNIYCYYGSWGAARTGNGKVASSDIPSSLCTHILYAFLGLQDNGTLQVLDQEIDINQTNIQKLSDLKKQNPSLKLIFSVGGTSATPNVFAGVANDDTKLATFSKSCLDFLDKYNFDGIDIDWEYPLDKVALIKMFQALRTAFTPKGYFLSTAVAYDPEDIGGYDVPAMSQVLDVINVMSYNFHAAYSDYTGQNSPLYGSPRESSWQQSVLNGNASIWNWRNHGAAPEKLALGAGFYGHTYILVNPNDYQAHAAASGPANKGPYTETVGTLGYNEICELHPNASFYWDDDQKVPILHDDTFWVGFDNVPSLQEKVKYVKQEKLSGIMMWSIETDDTKGVCGPKWPLLNAVHDAMNSN